MWLAKTTTRVAILLAAAVGGAYLDHRYRILDRVQHQLQSTQPPVAPQPPTMN